LDSNRCAHRYADVHFYKDLYVNRNFYVDLDANGHEYLYGYADAYADLDSHFHRDRYLYPHVHPDGDRYADSDSNAFGSFAPLAQSVQPIHGGEGDAEVRGHAGGFHPGDLLNLR
jgi:hypothetical protein